jgi:hypothetical protein
MKNNLNFKIIAIVVSIFIWLQITLMSDHQAEIDLELRLANAGVADSLLNTRGKIKSFVEGSGMDIIKLYFSQAFIEMEARDIVAGNDQNFEPRDVPQNLKISFLGVDPESAYGPELSSTLETNSQDPAGYQLPAGEAGIDGPSVSATQDNVQSMVLPDIPIEPPVGVRLFPATATLKVQGRSSVLANLPRGVSVRTAGKPDARGMYNLEASVPEGVSLLDITPRQVRAGK